MSEEKNLEGLRGWLILVGFGIIFSTIKMIVTIYPVYSDIFSSGSWEILTTPGAEAYHSLWAPIILGEIFVNAALVLVWLYIALLFFTKNKAFPIWYIGAAVFTLVFIVVDAAVLKLVLPNDPIFDPETVKELSRSLVSVAIWVPYMLISKRVKATFIK